MPAFDFDALRDDLAAGENGHAARHNEERHAIKALAARTRRVVYSDDYSTLQGAIDAAKSGSRPLIIAPGTHALSAPLVMDDCDLLHVSAYRATFSAVADMPAMLDMKNCTRCTWHGGRFDVPEGRTVDNAIYIYHDTSQSTRNAFYDVMIQGAYTVGIRVGQQGSGFQCDHMFFQNVECNGAGGAGQIGIYVGSGVHANCLNHTFRNIMCSGHGTHIHVDATNAYLDGVFLDRSDVDFYVASTQFAVRNVRSEGAGRLLVTGGPAGYGAMLTLEDVLWNGQEIEADGEWIQAKLAGGLVLRKVTIRNPAYAPKISVGATKPLRLQIDGMIAPVGHADMIDAAANVIVQRSGYITLDVNGHVESIA
jgi:hypothetical protein